MLLFVDYCRSDWILYIFFLFQVKYMLEGIKKAIVQIIVLSIWYSSIYIYIFFLWCIFINYLWFAYGCRTTFMEKILSWRPYRLYWFYVMFHDIFQKYIHEGNLCAFYLDLHVSILVMKKLSMFYADAHIWVYW